KPYFPVKISVLNAPPGGSLEVVVSSQGSNGPGYELGYDNAKQVVTGYLPNGNYTVAVVNHREGTATGSVNVAVNGGPSEGSLVLIPAHSIIVNVHQEFSSTQNDAGASGTAGGRDRLERLVRFLNVKLEPTDDFGHRGQYGIQVAPGPE